MRRLQIGRTAAERGDNRSWDRWKRAVFLVNRLQDINPVLNNSGEQNCEATQKYLETQQWLELVDA
jgi:hypothetical protein